MKPARRPAFSLMEVLLATSILLGSLIVLGQLATVGRKHARDAENLTAAQLLCQSKLNEILAGVEPVRSVEDQALPDAPGWVYSVEVESVGKLHLSSLRVTVAEELPELEDAAGTRPVKQFTLIRWIRDPDRQGTRSPDSQSLLTVPLGAGFARGELP